MRRRMTLSARRSRLFLRRPPKPAWFRPAVYLAGMVIGLSTGLGLGFWIVASGTVDQVRTSVVIHTLDLSGEAGLIVRNVYAEGRSRTDPDELNRQLGIAIGQPLLAVDTAAAKDRIEQLPWVDQASVSRMLPETIQIRLQERQPLALWQRAGSLVPIDESGAVIDAPVNDVGGWMGPDRLPVLVGAHAPQHAAQLFLQLALEPELWERVIAATRVGDRRWTVHLDNQIDVLLPERDFLLAWRLLARKARESALLDRATADLGAEPGALVFPGRTLVRGLVCGACGERRALLKRREAVSDDEARCGCGAPVEMAPLGAGDWLDAGEARDHAALEYRALGLPPEDLVIARAAQREDLHYLLPRFEEEFVGPYAGDVDAFMAWLHPDFTGWDYGEKSPVSGEEFTALATAAFDVYESMIVRTKPLSVLVMGDVAVLNTVYREVLVGPGGEMRVGGRWTVVAKKMDDEWKHLSWTWTQEQAGPRENTE